MSPFCVCCLFCYGAIHWAHITFIPYELLAVVFTQSETLDVDKWTSGVVPECKRTRTFSKCIQKIIKSVKRVHKATEACESSLYADEQKECNLILKSYNMHLFVDMKMH